MSDSGKYCSAVDGEKPALWSQLASGQWKQEFIGVPGSLVPRSVNNSGMVVGVRFTFDALTHAVIWTREAGQKQLEKPKGYVRSEALAVNNQGVVVGMIDGPGGSKVGPNAFAYEQGQIRLLDEGGPTFASAQAINDHRQITGVFEKDEDEVAPSGSGESEEAGKMTTSRHLALETVQESEPFAFVFQRQLVSRWGRGPGPGPGQSLSDARHTLRTCDSGDAARIPGRVVPRNSDCFSPLWCPPVASLETQKKV